MILKVKYRCLVLLLLMFSAQLRAQNIPFALHSFSFSQVDNRIRVFWTINEGYSCQQVDIEISVDTLNFTSIYTYPGICGLGQEETSYQHIFSSPLQSAYFRLNLGKYGITKPQHILLKENQKGGILLYPNPASDVINISLGSNHQKLFNIRIINAFGKLIYSNLNPRSLSLSINSSNWENGVYFIYTEDKNSHRIEFQKFVVSH